MYSNEYIQYLIEFHVTRDWFECHEIMEEVWKNEQDPEMKPTWHMLVKLAVGQYHERRGNRIGAAKLYSGFMSEADRIRWDQLGIDREKLCNMVAERLNQLQDSNWEENRREFVSMNLPIIDDELVKACEKGCETRELKWKYLNSHVSEGILHRHRLRDRTEVIAARELAKRNRQGMK
ncbi:DUF309 domain-containing protein [Paenibacillus marinisediminis]